MSYAFCYGPSGSGKSACLRKYVIERAQKSLARWGSERKKYIVVVPEQYSMQTQKELVEEHPAHVLMNIDVLSFGRLAYRVFEETGADRHMVLDDIGKSLLLRRVASGCLKELQILQRGIHRPGMIDEVKSVLSEFMQYGIDEDGIGKMAAYAGEHGQNALQARLLDIQRLYTEFQAAKKDRYITSEETLDLLAGSIPDAESLRGSVIIFDGFTGFTTVQYRVIRELIRCAEEVIFAFTYSKDRGPEMAVTAAGGSAGSKEDLFYLSRRTVADLLRMGKEEGFVRGRDIDLTRKDPDRVLPRFGRNRVLSHLEKQLFRYPERPFIENRKGETAQSLRLFAASTPQEEVRQIFSEVRRIIARTGCAYRDFAIVTADLETYGDLLALEAEHYDIPVYIDRTGSALHNILTEGIRSVLQISADNFSYASVFRYLRSGLSALTSEETDLLENYCLANGIRGRKKWSSPFDASCEEARQKFLRETAPVTGLETDPAPRRPRNAGQRTRELYDFLAGCGAQARMDALAEQFGEQGDVVRQKQYSQIYRTVIDLLDRIYDLAGMDKVSAQEYLELLEAGFAQIRLGTLPQRVDRILAGDIERTRLTQVRHLFFAGVNEGIIPRSAGRGGILSDMDREFLAGSGAVLAPTPRQQMFIQRLYLYLNMTKPSESLTVSYAASGQDGKGLRPSYLVSVLRGLFPALETDCPEQAPVSGQVTGAAEGLRLLADRLRIFVEGSAPDRRTFAQEFSLLYGFYTSAEVSADPGIRRAVQRLREAALFRYRPQTLSPAAARAIYGKTITGGISRMETAASCLLRQYLRYGLHLKERDQYEFQAVDAGTLLHAALQRFDGLLRSEGLSWRTFSPEEGRRLAQRALEEEAGIYRSLLLYKSARDEHRLGRFERRLARTVDTLQYQICRGDLDPAAAELSFGTPDAQMPAIRYDLGDGRNLLLIGRIDRVDLCVEDGVRFLRIMDYKSGRNDLKEDLIRRGLQLQLITYMGALLRTDPAQLDALAQDSSDAGGDGSAPMAEESAEVRPSAMLYYRMDDPVLSVTADAVMAGTAAEEQVRQERETQIRKALKPTGLVLEDEESIEHLHRHLSGSSDVIPVGRKTNGGYTAASRLIDINGFRELSGSADAVIRELGCSILDGEITASPAQIDTKKSACDLCPYREVCGFDPRIPGMEKRKET